jgi:NitT/TauT family transport system substrate-binding protein
VTESDLRPTRAAALRAALLALAGTTVPAAARAAAPVALHVGTIAAETDASIWYAHDLGYFRDAGLDVAIDVFTSGSAIAAGLASGALDVGVASMSSLSSAHLRGLPIFLIAPGGLHDGANPTTILAVAAASPIKNARDLNGKTIAVATLRELAQTAIMAWLDKNGGDAKTAAFIEMPPSSMPAALTAGRIDAGFIVEPFFSQAQSRGEVRFLAGAYDGIARRFLITGWQATKTWIDGNLATAKAFAAVMRRAAQWANANPAASVPILARYTKLAPEVIAGMHRTVFALTLDPATIQPVIDVSARYNTLPRAFRAGELIYPGFG